MRFRRHQRRQPQAPQRWALGEVRVLLDYAHNPDGLPDCFAGRRRIGGDGRPCCSAGNRPGRDIHALAAVAAEAKPDRVWLKDIGGDCCARNPAKSLDPGEAFMRRRHGRRRPLICSDAGPPRTRGAGVGAERRPAGAAGTNPRRATGGRLLDALQASAGEPARSAAADPGSRIVRATSCKSIPAQAGGSGLNAMRARPARRTGDRGIADAPPARGSAGALKGPDRTG